MVSLSASTPITISDLNHTFPAGITSLIGPGDLFTSEDIRGSVDMEMALTAGTINIIDENNVNLKTIKSIGLGDVSSGKAIIESASFVNLTASTVYSSSLLIDGVTAKTTDSFITAGTLNSTTLVLERNDGLPDVTVDLSSIAGGGSDKFVSGGTYSEPTSSNPKISFVGNSPETTFDVQTNIFGTYYYYAENLSLQNTNNNNYTNALSLTTGTVPSGVYRIGWSYEWGGNTGRDFEARVQVDGSTTMEVNMEAKDNSNFFGVAGFSNQTFGSSGTHVINFDFAGESGTTVRIRNLRLEFWKVSS